jgi:nucleoid-associated protein YgaU
MPEQPKDPNFSDVSGGSSSPAAQEYTVAAGDSLSKIAKRFYGNAKLWPLIHKANSDLIENPDLIQIGWTLTIPPKP